MKSFVSMMVMLLMLGLDHGFAQTSVNMEYFGNLNQHRAAGRYSACWGYVAADGREYALLGCYDGTAIIDISANPIVEVDFIPGPSSGWREMKTYRHYAYIVTESTNALTGGVQIVDLSFLPDSAMVVKNYVWVDSSGSTPLSFPATHSVSVSGNYLYLNGGAVHGTGIRILDLRDPVNPVKAGVFQSPYIHDSHIRNDFIYGAAINGQGLMIIDARDKSNLSVRKTISYTGSGTHNAWTTPDGNYVATTDEIGTTPKTLKVWDIRDLNNVTKVADYTNTTAIVHNVFIKGTLAYVAWYTRGIQVIDLANPAAPSAVAYYDTYPSNDSAIYDGLWGADPYFPSGKVIGSDMQTGLHVFRYTGDKRGIVRGTITDYWTGAPLPDVLLHFPDLSITRFTAQDGTYIFGYAPGTYRVILERLGFGSVETSVTVVQDSTVTVNFSPFAITSVERPTEIPSAFHLHQNFPNPFNPSTTISYDLPVESYVSLKVYTLLGNEVATLVDGVRKPGAHTVSFDASRLSSGVYFYALRAAGSYEIKKMTFMK